MKSQLADQCSILSLHRPNQQTLTAYMNEAHPFKVTGELSNFPLFKNLSQLSHPDDRCDYLGSLAPKEKVHYSLASKKNKSYLGHVDNGSLNYSLLSRATEFSQFCELLKDYHNNPEFGTLYFQACGIKALNQYLKPLTILDTTYNMMHRPNFWIGHCQKLVLHNDPNRNIIGVFSGKKDGHIVSADDAY